MKTLIIVTVLLQFITLNTLSQVNLRNSHWKGYIKELKNAEVKVDFKEDTVLFLYTYPIDQQGIFTFTQHKDTLTIFKVSGPGGCPARSQGVYTIETIENGKKFLLHFVSDECPDRINSLTSKPFERIYQ